MTQGSVAAESDQIFDVQDALRLAGLSVRDPFAILRHLVQQLSSSLYGMMHPPTLGRQLMFSSVGCEGICELSEPQHLSTNRINDLESQARATMLRTIYDTSFATVHETLSFASGFPGSPVQLLDISELRSVAEALWGNDDRARNLGTIDLNAANVPFDKLSLLFATLALHNYTNPNEQILLAFLELSTILVEDYAGEPTVHLVLALFFQHICVLLTGTSNRSRALILHAIRVAHDIGLNRPSETVDPRSLRVYLLLYYTDQ